MSFINSPSHTKFYESISNRDYILKYIKLGKRDFSDFIESLKKAHVRIEKYESQVHDPEDVELQALSLAILTTAKHQKPGLIIRKNTFLIELIHLIDDLFDRPDGLPYEIMYQHRFDAEKLISHMEELKPAGQAMLKLAQTKKQTEAIKMTLLKTNFGGLIQRADNSELQRKLLIEYREFSSQGLNKDFSADILKIDSVHYYMTTGVASEAYLALDERANPNLSELMNILAAPLLYSHNHLIEISKGEAHFFDQPHPTDKGSMEMLDITLKHIKKYDDFSGITDQMNFFLKLFKENISKDLYNYYSSKIIPLLEEL